MQRKSVILISCAVGVLANIQIAGAQEAASGAGSRNENEIIVTAQKREQRLQDVPSSVSALSAADLEAQGQVQLAD